VTLKTKRKIGIGREIAVIMRCGGHEDDDDEDEFTIVIIKEKTINCRRGDRYSS